MWLDGASVPTLVVDARADAERIVADEIVALLRENPALVLGLATGNSPVGVYRELCAAQAAGRVSFANASTFNLDEYLELPGGDPRSFRRWMEEHLFDRVKPRAVHMPECTALQPEPARVGEAYERLIQAAGGIDVQLLGIGRNGHIGFNEPGAPRLSRTRVVELHPATRELAASAFGAIAHVPKRAITMGVATILAARRIRVLAFGAGKAEIVKRALVDEVSSACPVTFLRGHPDVKLFVDREAAAAVTR